jgi:hypothetical protein
MPPPFDRRHVVTRRPIWRSGKVLARWLSKMSFTKLFLLCFGAGLLTFWISLRIDYPEAFLGVAGIFYVVVMYRLNNPTRQTRRRK